MRFLIFVSALILCAVHTSFAKDKTPPELTANEKKLMEAIGGKLDGDQNIVLGKAVINRTTKEISFPARTNIRYGTIEVLISSDKGRSHESLFISELDPFHLQLALILAGYNNGPVLEGTPLPQGAKFDVMVTTPDKKTVKADSWLANAKLQEMKADDGYVFVGSNFQGTLCVASLEGNIININSGDSNTILNASLGKENVFDEYVAVGERIYGYVKPPEGEVPGQVDDVDVTITLVPRKSDKKQVNTETAPEKVAVPKTEDFTAKQIAEVTFSGREIIWDYDKLIPALNYPLVRDNPKASLAIIDAKIALMDKFFAIYEKTHETNDYLKKIQEIYGKTKTLRDIYATSSSDSGK